MVPFGSPLQGYLETGSLLAFISVFGAGILTSFTPCIYPMIPITIGVIGGTGKTSRLQAFTLSLVYVTGMALTYAALGVAASLTGRIFGRISANPWVLLAIANMIILFGLSMLDVFTLPLPRFMTGMKAGGGRGGVIGAFGIGLASGLVAAPCTAPVMGVLLAFVATRQNIFFGGALLFTFAMGMNMLLLAIGTFAGLMTALPRSGMWMVRIKKAMGILMIGVGEYFLIEAGKYWL